MKQAAVNWILMLLAFFVGGPVVSAVYSLAHSSTGGPGVVALLSTPMVGGLVALVGAAALAGVIGVVCARLSGQQNGMRCAGFALAWAAFDAARIDDVLRHNDGAFVMLALEALIAGGVVLGFAVLMWRLSGAKRAEGKGSSAGEAAIAVAIASIVGMLFAGAVARNEMFGQCIAATIGAGVVGTLVARLMYPGAPLRVCYAAGIVLGAGLQIVAAGIEGGSAVQSIDLGSYLAIARPMPLDWIAGYLIGVPLGASWAESMVEKQQEGASAGDRASAGSAAALGKGLS